MKSGILAIDKPDGLSSARVVARVKRLLGAKKVGHTGTLDPFATGLLLVAVNKATRISRFFLGGDKSYRADLCLGARTDTHDRTGQVTFRADPGAVGALVPDRIREVIRSFRGEQDQRAPAFSALKHQGKPLYALARQGKKVEKPPRRVTIHDLDILEMALPVVRVRVDCSGGTYIRSLARDIGQTLGCGAHLAELRRTRSSNFSLDQAIALESLEAQGRDRAWARLIPMARCLDFLPRVRVDGPVMEKIGHGRPLTGDDLDPARIPAGTSPDKADGSVCLLDDSGALAAIVIWDKDGQRYNYSCVFST